MPPPAWASIRGSWRLWIEARSLQVAVWRYVSAGTALPSGSTGTDGDTRK